MPTGQANFAAVIRRHRGWGMSYEQHDGWTASSIRSNGSRRSSSASWHSTSSCRCCCAISSAISIPDAYDFGQLLLGILIFWGIAATSYRGTHITVDLLWAECQHRTGSASSTCSRRWCCCSSFRCRPTRCTTRSRAPTAANVADLRLRLPVWPFFAVAWIGDVAAVLLIAVRTYRLIFHPELMKPVDEISKSGE